MYKLYQDLSAQVQALVEDQIRHGLPTILEAARAKGWCTKEPDDLQAFYTPEGRAAEGIEVAWVGYDYILLFTVTQGWWLGGNILLEEFLVRVTEPADFSLALRDIEQLGRDRGCKSVIIGTAASPSDKAYSRLLRRHGYTEAAYQLIKSL